MKIPRPVPAAPTVVYRPWRPNPWALTVIMAALTGLVLGASLSLVLARGPLAKYEYHLWRWEAEQLAGSAFALAGIGPDPDEVEAEEALRNYFGLTSRIRAELESEDPDHVLVEALMSERSLYEKDVERVIRKYVDEAIGEAGLQRGLPLFNDVRLTWPPVDFRLTGPPRVLVRSPRDEIRRSGDTLLRSDLTFAEIEAIEQRVDNEDTVSVVVTIGGLAAYPAIIHDNRSYRSMLEVVAHEWTHHYLAFYPLGMRWGAGGEMTTLNESVADVVGRELARMIEERHPISFEDGMDGRAPASEPPTVDFREVMHDLRLRVDALLAEGRVAEAEALMEQTRQYLAENGIYIRKINQAYFAFYGSYGESPASSSPVGPMVDELWDRTQDVGLFLSLAREVTSLDELERLLEKLRGTAP
ncbi:MAG: hypothetical protein Kow0010_09380 [Dehalococcoidia bacterium]